MPKYLETQFWNVDTAFGLSPKAGLNNKFLYYYCLSYDFSALNRGTTIPSLVKTELLEIPIPVPPLPEQKRIVAIQAFANISQAVANAEKNLANARELFDSYLNEVFTRKGEGWETKKFSDVLNIRNGRNQKAVESENGTYPILGSAGNVMAYATDYICEAGTTIIGRKGNISTPIYVETQFWNVDTAFGLSPKAGLHNKFLYYYCLSYDFAALNRGTTIPSLVKSELLEIPIPFPSLAEQKRIVAILDEILFNIRRTKDVYERKLAALAELKQALLQKAFTGELTV